VSNAETFLGGEKHKCPAVITSKKQTASKMQTVGILFMRTKIVTH